MASRSKRMWLHDEDNTTQVLPYTTLDSIKMQPNTNEDVFTDFEEDYDNVKSTIVQNKINTDNALNNLDTRVTALENVSPGGQGSAGLATPSANGLMSKEDKAKLDTVAEGANRYVLPKASTNNLGGIKVDDSTATVDEDGVLHILGGGGGATTLEGLTNVKIEHILDGDILMYDHEQRKWINTLPEGLGGGSDVDVDYISFDDIIELFNDEDTTYYYNLNKAY